MMFYFAFCFVNFSIALVSGKSLVGVCVIRSVDNMLLTRNSLISHQLSHRQVQ
jgi:hypothetical protein